MIVGSLAQGVPFGRFHTLYLEKKIENKELQFISGNKKVMARSLNVCNFWGVMMIQNPGRKVHPGSKSWSQGPIHADRKV